MAQQLELSLKTWGGRRKGAGRKPKGEKAGVVHLRRPRVSRHSPVHVTLRRGKYPAAVVTALSAGKKGVGFRLVHYSIQSNHLHLIVEAADNKALARGMKALNVRVARAVNRLRGAQGRVFSDRYHAHVLSSPREAYCLRAGILPACRSVTPSFMYSITSENTGRRARESASTPAHRRRVSTASSQVQRALAARTRPPSWRRAVGFSPRVGDATGSSIPSRCRAVARAAGGRTRDDRAIRAFSARYGVSAISERGAVEAWIFDDTGMLKQGKHSSPPSTRTDLENNFCVCSSNAGGPNAFTKT